MHDPLWKKVFLEMLRAMCTFIQHFIYPCTTANAGHKDLSNRSRDSIFAQVMSVHACACMFCDDCHDVFQVHLLVLPLRISTAKVRSCSRWGQPSFDFVTCMTFLC